MEVIGEKVFIGTRSCEDKIKQFKRKELERRFSYESGSDNRMYRIAREWLGQVPSLLINRMIFSPNVL